MTDGPKQEDPKQVCVVERLVAKVDVSMDATYTDVAAIAEAIEESGYDVEHVIRPARDEPHLYITEDVEHVISDGVALHE